jgi:hypothetical protein
MFIVWGKTIKRRKQGFVADYCAVCRDLRTFQVNRIGSASHVYYISFGQGELVGYERVCGVCSTPVEADPHRYPDVSNDRRPANELISETFPNYYSVYREAIERDRKLRDTPSLLTPEERRTRMREPFMLIAPIAQQKLASTQWDWRVLLALFSFPFIFMAVAAVAKLFTGPDQEPSEAFIFGGLAVWLGYVVYEIYMSSRRYLLKHAVPPLATSLVPLKPSEAEVAAIVDEFRRAKLKLGKLRAQDLLDHMEQLRTAV